MQDTVGQGARSKWKRFQQGFAQHVKHGSATRDTCQTSNEMVIKGAFLFLG
jgi:hypothetical protein